jgi:hypothetical protein
MLLGKLEAFIVANDCKFAASDTMSYADVTLFLVCAIMGQNDKLEGYKKITEIRNEVSLVIMISLSSLPRFFNGWHIYDPSFDRCARRFGEIHNIDRSHREITVLLVFNNFNSLLLDLLKIANSYYKLPGDSSNCYQAY